MELLELDDDQPKKGGKLRKLILISIAVVVLLAGIGGGVWHFYFRDHAVSDNETVEKKKEEPEKPPVFLALDPFIVNLQPSPIGRRMQIAMSLQVGDEEHAEKIKQFMPEVRSRLLILLSGQSGSDISTTEGKAVLANQIIQQVNMPFTGRKDEQHVTAVFFTSFVIQ
jgi:flagellar protein FliL